MSKWKTVKLGEVGVIITGNTPKTSDKENYLTNDISFYRPSDIVERNVSYLNSSEDYVSEVARSKVRILPKGSILVTCIGIIGKIGILEHEATCNQQINAIIPDQNICLNRYIAYSIFFNRDRLRDIANAPVVPIVNKTQFSNMLIPLPPLEEQKRIADILDKASNLIELRKQQLEKMDLLIKSKFIDMFGDKGFPEMPLNKLCSIITDGTHQSPKFVEKGIPFLFISNIVDNKITYQTEKHITHKTYEALIKRTPIELGDILLTIVGSYGNPAIVENVQPFCFQRHIAYMKPIHEKINSYYLHAAFLVPQVRQQIDVKVKGIAQKTLNLSELKTVMIPVPPLALQKKFASFVEQVEKQKSVMQQSLEEMEINYKALLQKYFG